jgi:hypothetical protein
MDMNIKLFKLKVKKEDLLSNKELFYEYISKLRNKNIIIKGIYEKYNNDIDECIIFDNSFEIINKCNLTVYKNKLFKEMAIEYNKENLTSKLVSELKEIAKKLNISQSKEVDGKKKPLLKGELVEQISIILSSIRENGN